MTQPIRVLVVDDSSFMRGALVRMIEKDPRFKVIDTATNGKEGVEKAQALRPDVVTMDVEMPVMTGLEALRAIMASVRTPVIMVSTLTESGAATTMEALEAGAVDFLPKAFGDKERNIFRGAENLHDKLLTAAGVANGRPEKLAEAKPTGMPVATPPRPVTPLAGLPAKVQARVVVIGSSTGGPKALHSVLQKLPPRLTVPVVVAQHMPPQFTLALAKRLSETCPPEVVEGRNGEALLPGKVYIGPGGMHMRVTAHGTLQIDEDKGESPYRPSVDVLAESARVAFGRQVVGVMLTGMGNDGTREFVRLKQDGAYIIAQDEASSVVYGMPKAVLTAGGVDEVLAADDIGARLSALLA